MYDDFPEEAKGLKYFLSAVVICAVGLVGWMVVAQPIVITSYSIHYTKLYERRRSIICAGWSISMTGRTICRPA